MVERLQLWRLANFDVERLPAARGRATSARAVARTNPKDQRLFALGEVRDLTPVRDDEGRIVALPQLERVLLEALEGMRRVQAPLAAGTPLPVEPRAAVRLASRSTLTVDEVERVARRLAPATDGLGIEEVGVQCLRPDPGHRRAAGTDRSGSTTRPGRGSSSSRATPRPSRCVPLDEYTQKVVQSRRRNAPYPYELVKLLVRIPRAGGRADVTGGSFVEHDLDERRPARPRRPLAGRERRRHRRRRRHHHHRPLPGGHRRGSRSSATPRRRSARWPSRSAGASSPRSTSPSRSACRSSGSRCRPAPASRWTAAPRTWTGSPSCSAGIIEFTQAGGEVNVVVTGINVGAQPYWNAEATMLMHTKGILVMTPDSAMVLTGKQALDYSGSVSAEDNLGIGGYERIMGPNGQGQYWAPDLPAAPSACCSPTTTTAYVLPGERFPRRAATERSVRPRRPRPSPTSSTAARSRTVGDIFSEQRQPRAQAALRHPHRDAGRRRPGPRARSNAGPT